MPYFYISFATDEGFRGATVVMADGADDAIAEATRRGLNPGGQAAIIEAPPECENEPDFRALINRLLGREEMLEQGGRRLGDLSEEDQEVVIALADSVCEGCNPVSFIPPPRS